MSKAQWEALGVTEEQLNREMSKTKVGLFFGKHSEFLATIMQKLKFSWDFSIKSANTNGLTLKWNPVFFLECSKDARVFVLAHELWHVAYQHMLRLDNRHHKKWNWAGDYVINGNLFQHGYVFDHPTFKLLHDTQYYGMSTEEVYTLIPDPPDEDGGFILIDDLSPPEDDLDGSQTEEITATVIQAMQAARMGRDAGDLPGEITQILDRLLRPKIHWKPLLRRWFTDRARQDYSWMRPNRRYSAQDIILPGMLSDDSLTSLACFFDVSGSVYDEDCARFNTEFWHVKKEFEPEQLHLITFDHRIQNRYIINQDDPYKPIEITGRGGTDLDPVADEIDRIRPAGAIIFTDLCCAPMRKLKHKIPVLWISVGNPGATVPFGQILHIDNE